MAYILEVIVKKEVPLISALIVGFIHASVMEETDIAYFISNLFSTSFFYSTFMNYKYQNDRQRPLAYKTSTPRLRLPANDNRLPTRLLIRYIAIWVSILFIGGTLFAIL